MINKEKEDLRYNNNCTWKGFLIVCYYMNANLVLITLLIILLSLCNAPSKTKRVLECAVVVTP